MAACILTVSPNFVSSEPPQVHAPTHITIAQSVAQAFPNDPVMVSIARCESKFHQFNADGTVFRGKINPQDIGVFQINEHYNLATAKRLGFDIYTLKGNLAMAKWMYTHQGTTPWDWSKSCWSA